MPARDLEDDLRRQLGQDARTAVKVLRAGSMSVDGAINYFVRRSFGSASRLLDARDRLGEPDAEARALLLRASRRADDPTPPAPTKPFSPPNAPGPA
jgi:hypothetical protein